MESLSFRAQAMCENIFKDYAHHRWQRPSYSIITNMDLRCLLGSNIT
jgi:hypothetical protein